MNLHKEQRAFMQFGYWRKTWWVRGQHGAIELQCTDYGKERNTKHFQDRFSGGVETHFAVAPEYMAGDAPSHNKCTQLGDHPCWHDGSSMAFDEFKHLVEDEAHDLIFAELERWYMDRFHPQEGRENP